MPTHLALHGKEATVHIVHQVQRATVRIHHADRALCDGENERVNPHLALHSANDVQQRTELVARALRVAVQIGILQCDARLRGKQTHHILVRRCERTVFLVDCLQNTHDASVHRFDWHAQDVDGAVARCLVRANVRVKKTPFMR